MPDKPPLKHIAIVPDGNGRWATRRLKPRMLGHRRGTQALKDIINEALRHPELEVLSVFAFSTENQTRPGDEVRFLMQLISSNIDESFDDLNKKNVKLKVVGDTSCYPPKLADKLATAVKNTSDNTGLTLVFAFYYSGRWDITRCVRSLVQSAIDGQISAESITQELITNTLSMGELPEPDLLIRTSGEQRISNFMLWECAYTEFYFSKKLWPDFTPDDFKEAIASYYSRERRYGQATMTKEVTHA